MYALLVGLVLIYGLIVPNSGWSFIKRLHVDKNVFLNAHNEIRQKTASGGYSHLPRGNIGDLKWDDKLAEVSQRWIEFCYEKGHSEDRFRESISGYKPVGENMAYSWSTEMEKTMQNSTEVARIVVEFIKSGWSDSEAENFRYGSGRISGGAVTSHFTQVIWAETTHVGCAVGYCKSDNKHKLILNCNYYPKGNFGYKPYPLSDEGSRAKKTPQLSIKHGHEKTPNTTPDSKLVKKREARKTTKKDSRWSLINDQTKRTRSYHLSTTRMPAIIKSNDKTQQWNINANDIENDIYVDDQPMTKKPSQSVDQTHNFKKAQHCNKIGGWKSGNLKESYKNCKTADYCSSLESRGFDSPEKCRDWCNGILKWVDYCKFK